MLRNTTTITRGREILTLINTFTVEPEDQQAVADSLAEVTEARMQHLPGFLGASVHRSLDGRRVVNYVQWETQAHFQAMFQDPAARAHVDQVQSLAVSVEPVLYAVAYVGAV